MAEYIVDKRVWVDIEFFNILADLFKTTRGLIPRYELCSAILEEWLNSGGNIKVGNVKLDTNISKKYRHCLWLIIEEDIWNEFLEHCSLRGLNINVAFRIAVYSFIDMVDLWDGNYEKLLVYFFDY